MRTRSWVFLALAGTAVVTAVVTTVLISVFERKQEARRPFFRVVELTEETDDPEVWGKNFPIQFDQWKRTVDQVRTRFGGSEAMPRTPTKADPRSIVAQSRLEDDPRLKTMWAGYAFSRDFREERGHAYMLEDQTFTERQRVVKQPGTCGNCHASTYVPMKALGGGDIRKGFDALNAMPYAEARKLLTHPIACIDCHAADTMALRITRPAFLEGMREVKAREGVRDYDVNRDATRQEMRSYVCGQCHVEYYFQGAGKRLVYPWRNGRRADEILAYYEAEGFTDWEHAETGARVLKAQHPEFELWSQGIHARSGVSCADCHMPYQRDGATKVSDHWVRSPLLNINRACQTCHHFPEEEIKSRVDAIQDRNFQLLQRGGKALMDQLDAIADAKKRGVTQEQLQPALELQRQAQWRLDFIAAENSMGFHAPQEAAKVLAEAIDLARQGERAALKAAGPP